MRNVLEEDHFVSQGDPIEKHQVLVNLPHITHVRNDRQVEFLCEKAYGQKFAHTTEAGHIGLHLMNGIRLKEILEYHSIRYVFSNCQPDWCNLACQHRMPEYVVGMRRLFHPQRV
jgi:hypothetical protein